MEEELLLEAFLKIEQRKTCLRVNNSRDSCLKVCPPVTQLRRMDSIELFLRANSNFLL